MKQQLLAILKKEILVNPWSKDGFFQKYEQAVLLQVFQKANIFKKMQLFLAKEILKIIINLISNRDDFLPMHSTTINASLNEL